MTLNTSRRLRRYFQSVVCHNSPRCFALFHCRQLAAAASHLLMLTPEEDAFFVLAPTVAVSGVFTSPGCCCGNRQSLAARVGRARCRKPGEWHAKIEQEDGPWSYRWMLQWGHVKFRLIATNSLVERGLGRKYKGKYPTQSGLKMIIMQILVI